MNIVFKHLAPWLVAGAFALPALAGGDSSDGHSHAVQAPVAPSPMPTASPRMVTQTEQFEIVGVLHGKVLTLYLDQFATNMPVIQAQIEVESGTWSAVGTEVSPGVYAVPAELLSQPGKHPLAITVQAAEIVDLLDANMEVGSISAGDPHTTFWGESAPGWFAVALALMAMVLFALRRFQQRATHRTPERKN